MGLLSKARANPSHCDEAPSQGGLLKLISQKHLVNTENIIENEIMQQLYSSFEKYGKIQGLIIDAAIKCSEREFAKRLISMVSGFGTTQGLAPRRAMILFDSSHDNELIGYHLAKTVPGSVFNFQANNPQDAFSFIKPYL